MFRLIWQWFFPRKKNEVWETMTRITYSPWVVRVWREGNQSKNDLKNIVRSGKTATDIAKTIGSLPGVAAVEVLNASDGCGCVYYPDWK